MVGCVVGGRHASVEVVHGGGRDQTTAPPLQEARGKVALHKKDSHEHTAQN